MSASLILLAMALSGSADLAGRVDDAAAIIEAEPIGIEWGTSDIPALALEPVAVVSRDVDSGMEREGIDVTAQLARDEASARVALATTQALDCSAALRPERHAALHRCRAQLREERLVGCGRIGVVVLGAWDPAAALEVAQDASMQEGGKPDDVLICQRGSFVEDRSRERTGVRVNAVEDEHVQVLHRARRRQQAARDELRHRLTDADHEAQRPDARPALVRADELVSESKDLVRAAIRHATHFGRDEAAAFLHEELLAENALELLHLRADRRMRQLELVGCARPAALAKDESEEHEVWVVESFHAAKDDAAGGVMRRESVAAHFEASRVVRDHSAKSGQEVPTDAE